MNVSVVKEKQGCGYHQAHDVWWGKAKERKGGIILYVSEVKEEEGSIHACRPCCSQRRCGHTIRHLCVW